MFSRRHPILFFVLIMAAILSGTMIITSAISVVADVNDIRLSKESKIGVVEVIGPIADSKKIIEDLILFREDPYVKAIVVRIDSPGGGVGPSQEIYREIEKTALDKKVISSFGSVAASGGYYIAAATNGIMSNPGTITGSIGVIVGYTNFQELLKTIGLKPVVFKSGELKDMGSPLRSLTENEKAVMQGLVDSIHKQFVRDVSLGRDLDIKYVEKLADGRIFTGEEAREKGLVDRLGNLEDAISWAKELAGVEKDAPVIYPPEEPLSVLQSVLEGQAKALLNEMTTPGLSAQAVVHEGTAGL